MKSKLIVASLIIGGLLTPVLSNAEDKDVNRTETKTYVKDSVITTKIKAKLADQKLSSLLYIQVDTSSKGEVLLTGDVRTQAELDTALAIVHQVDGVTSVENRIKINKDL